MRIVFTCLFIGLSGLLAGCSANPLSPTGEAVYYALATDTQLRSWVDSCKAVDSQSHQQALLTQRNWWQRNGAFIQGADYGLAYDMVQISAERAETGARLALAMTWNIVQDAETEVQKRLAKKDAKLVCQTVLAEYDSGKFDISSKSPWYKELVNLQQRQQQAGADLSLKQASVVLKTGKQYGRSFYVIENMAKRHGCPRAMVQLLKNDWPNEVYEARCQDDSYLLMQCEWGNCRISQ